MYLELAWLLLTWLCVSIEATGWFAERLSELEPRMETGIASLLPTTPLPFDSFSLADIPRILLKVPVAIARSLFFVTIHPLSTSVWMMVFFVWAVYELVAARSANRHLLVAFPAGSTGNVGSHTGGNANPEDDWGFGQLMPLFLLILPVLQIVDVLSEASVVESAQVKSQSQAHPHQGQVQVDSRSRGARSSQVSAHQAVLRRTRSGLVPGAGFAGS
ncbi:hypothetical protein BJY04DRAFT_199437 [Aspergillus karnatakaensis]|uniref:uncharacterized protein n=1 Tax=Aspergillus karnatakaensis TaxID=1810916 RepID=UPI003CCCDB95